MATAKQLLAEIDALKAKVLDADQCAARALEGRDKMIAECLRLEKSPHTWVAERERLTRHVLAYQAKSAHLAEQVGPLREQIAYLRADIAEARLKIKRLRLQLKTQAPAATVKLMRIKA